MMLSISLLFLLSASVQVSAGNFKFYMSTTDANTDHCDALFAPLGISLVTTFDPAPITVANAIDATIAWCSEEATGDQYGPGVQHVTAPTRRTLRAIVTSRQLQGVCSGFCECIENMTCMMMGYCADTCGSGQTCDCEGGGRRLEETFEDANEGAVQDAVETQRDLQSPSMSEIIISGCTGALTTLADDLVLAGNYCLGDDSGDLAFEVNIIG
jgi:hypothetical protein